MKRRGNRTGPAAIQSGAALIVSLILLMVLTVLAVSTLGTARQGLLMAGNTQFRENAFRLAQDGIDAVVNVPAPPAVPDCPAGVADPAVAVPALGGSYVTEVCYRDESPCEGYSASFRCLNYEVAATGLTDAREARATLVQGFALVGVPGE